MKFRFLMAVPLLAVFVLLAPLVISQDGPSKDPGETVAKPRKKSPAESDLPPIPSKLSNKNKSDVPEGSPSFKVETSLVSVDVAVLDNKGHFIPNIPRGNFRILEDDVPQLISTFGAGEAPMTVCMVIEFSARFQSYWSSTWYQTLSAAYGFLETLKPEDYVAVVAYDLHTDILSDFSADKMRAREAMARLRIPGFSESNMYDAVVDTADRMSGIEGRKAIVLIASGLDTFSKLTFDKARKGLQDAGVPIYAIGLMQALRMMAEARGSMGPIQTLDFLQADNQMRLFAKETGGQSFFPRFYGEFPSIFHSIAESLRKQYSIGYQPSNLLKDGKFRKIKVELVNPENNQPLLIKDEKSKPVKFEVLAKPGYTAPKRVE
jgi:Ca-activated chloride channel homolog